MGRGDRKPPPTFHQLFVIYSQGKLTDWSFVVTEINLVLQSTLIISVEFIVPKYKVAACIGGMALHILSMLK